MSALDARIRELNDRGLSRRAIYAELRCAKRTIAACLGPAKVPTEREPRLAEPLMTAEQLFTAVEKARPGERFFYGLGENAADLGQVADMAARLSQLSGPMVKSPSGNYSRPGWVGTGDVDLFRQRQPDGRFLFLAVKRRRA